MPQSRSRIANRNIYPLLLQCPEHVKRERGTEERCLTRINHPLPNTTLARPKQDSQACAPPKKQACRGYNHPFICILHPRPLHRTKTPSHEHAFNNVTTVVCGDRYWDTRKEKSSSCLGHRLHAVGADHSISFLRARPDRLRLMPLVQSGSLAIKPYLYISECRTGKWLT